MLQTERHEQIMAILKQKKNVSIQYLLANLFVSISTLRRDLIELEKSGRIKRQHGSVSLSLQNSSPSFQFRERACMDEKIYICNIARRFLANNLSVFIDASSTTYNICSVLPEFQNLVAITTGLKTASWLSALENVNAFFPGGKIDGTATAVKGESTIEFLNHFNIDVAFFSSLGLDEYGASDVDIDHANIKQSVIKNAKKKILLADSSKFGTRHFYRLVDYTQIDCIITDKQPDSNLLKKIRAEGCEVIWV